MGHGDELGMDYSRTVLGYTDSAATSWQKVHSGSSQQSRTVADPRDQLPVSFSYSPCWCKFSGVLHLCLWSDRDKSWWYINTAFRLGTVWDKLHYSLLCVCVCVSLGLGIPQLLQAILRLMPLDTYVPSPVHESQTKPTDWRLSFIHDYFFWKSSSSTGCSDGPGRQRQTEMFSSPCVGHLHRAPESGWVSGKTACPTID